MIYFHNFACVVIISSSLCSNVNCFDFGHSRISSFGWKGWRNIVARTRATTKYSRCNRVAYTTVTEGVTGVKYWIFPFPIGIYLQLPSKILADTFDLSPGAHFCEYACWAPQFRYGNYISEAAAVLTRLKSLTAVPSTHTDESTQSDDAIVR